MITMDAKEKLMKCAISTPDGLGVDEDTKLLLKGVCIQMLFEADVITDDEKSEMLKPIAKDMLKRLIDHVFHDDGKEKDNGVQ